MDPFELVRKGICLDAIILFHFLFTDLWFFCFFPAFDFFFFLNLLRFCLWMDGYNEVCGFSSKFSVNLIFGYLF